jgi:beta-glucosidase
MMGFPPGFVWGAATSAFQIEGGRTDGKGQSIWDTFSDQGRMRNRADLACDHYHRWPDDVALMADLGLDAYRMSIAWTRILPDGTGTVNQKGLDFYKKLIDAVIEAGITPWVTLHHWDLPQTLQNQGGWAARETVGAFVKYAEIVAQALGDRVSHWITQNEPWVAAILGYAEGVFAPGVRDWKAGILAGHHLLLSHGEGMAAIRSHSADAQVGIALDCRPSRPASQRPQDIDAWTHFDGYRNRWFFDPVFGHGYPEDIISSYQGMGRIKDSDWIRPGDLETISSPIDFLGLNYYTSLVIKEGQEEGEYTGVDAGPNPPPGFTETGWSVTPEAFTEILRRIHKEYWEGPIYITENGASYSDGPGADGVVRDVRRIEYLRSHLAAIETAIDEGVPVGGYFHWALLDNLEWLSGFSQRFGFIHVDPETLVRTPKASFEWYREVIARNGLS